MAMSDRDRPGGGGTGLSDQEAKEFHSLFITSFLAFTGIAAVAHWLVWTWRPWLPGARGYTSLIDGATQSLASIAPWLI